MFIELTDTAEKELQKMNLQPTDRILLMYDSEGCGCAVSGVVALWITGYEPEDSIRAESNSRLPLYYLPRHELFFEDKLRLDYKTERRSFQLSGDGQIYGANIGVSDLRSASPKPSGAPR